MMKKARRAPMESSPSSSSYPIGEEARARWKHQSLMQDYNELVKETEAKKMKLQKAIERKLKLLAEVKFLRKKYKSLSENPSQEAQYRLKKKKKSQKIQSPSLRINPPPIQVNQIEVPSKDSRNRGIKEYGAPSTSRLLDLNQVSEPSCEEMQEFQAGWEHLEAEKMKRGPMDKEAAANDLKLSICRDAGSNASRVGKRKISWQDQVALRV